MRMLIAAAALTSIAGLAGSAQAQGMAGHGHPGGPGMHASPVGGRMHGRWWGGSRAPGGWAAYRAPVRGWVLPRYWIAPQFYVVDWRGYGLPQPPVGYRWSRYYDDAVLIDDRGSVYDTMGGIDWDRAALPDPDYAYEEPGFPGPGAGFAPPPPRGPGGYPPPPSMDPGPVVTATGGGRVHSETLVTGGGYYAAGYYYPPATVTTITIDNPDCGETTHTEYVTERVVRPRAPRRPAPTKLLRRTPTKALRR